MLGYMKNWLANPEVYTLFQRAVRGPGERLYIQRHVRANPGDRVLDIGCGTGDIVRHIPDVEYVGFDMDEKLIDQARRTRGDGRTFYCCDLSHVGAENLPPFDLALATGVLHHLTDDECMRLFHLARQALSPGGRLVTLDGCYAEGQSCVARFLLANDRGKYVRAPDQYAGLAEQVFDRVVPTVYERLFRIPSSILVMECSSGTKGSSPGLQARS